MSWRLFFSFVAESVAGGPCVAGAGVAGADVACAGARGVQEGLCGFMSGENPGWCSFAFGFTTGARQAFCDTRCHNSRRNAYDTEKGVTQPVYKKRHRGRCLGQPVKLNDTKKGVLSLMEKKRHRQFSGDFSLIKTLSPKMGC